MLDNNFNEMATRARTSEKRVRKAVSLLFIYLFVCIHQGQGSEFTSIYKSADHYWPMKNISDNTSIDVVGLAHAAINNGAKLNRTTFFGPAVMLDGKDDCIILELLNEDCTNTPSKCHDGFTIAFWLYYIQGEFLLCTGTYVNRNKGPGIKFTFDEEKKLFVLEISTLNYTWKVTTRMIRRAWVHVGFAWSIDQGIHLYLNGSAAPHQKASKEKVMFERPRSNRGWSIGRPNEIIKLNKYGRLGISHLALWRRELMPIEVVTAYIETTTRDQTKLIEKISDLDKKTARAEYNEE